MNAMTPITLDKASQIVEAVITRGDLADLTDAERAKYYVRVCESVGLNPMTQPFAYITLQGRLTLYARKDATDQLRSLRGVSIEIVGRQLIAEVLTVHVRAKDKDGRVDEDFGAVAFPENLRGVERANTILKAITKAKRRVTLSICGLGWLDETEVEDIPAGAKTCASERVSTPENGSQSEQFSEPSREPDSEEQVDHEALEAAAQRRADQWGNFQGDRLLKAVRAWQPKPAPQPIVWDDHGERAPTTDDGLDIPPALDRRPKREPTLKEKLLAGVTELASVRDVLHYGLEMSKFDRDLSAADRDEIAGALRARQKVLMLNGGGVHAR
jgi:hypothetical protein